MRIELVLFITYLFSVFLSFGNTATTIQINGKSCKYSVNIPAGWDTIPADTLKSKFGNKIVDIGIYNKENKGYFDGEYIQYIFLPTIKTLDQFTFAQITKEVQNSIDFTNKQQQNGKARLIIVNFKADKDNQLFYVTGKIVAGTKERQYSQFLFPTKFGYIKALYCSARGENQQNLASNELIASINILNNYKYTEPASKFNLNIWHIIVAFSIGLAVYFSIQYTPNIRQLVQKKETL